MQAYRIELTTFDELNKHWRGKWIQQPGPMTSMQADYSAGADDKDQQYKTIGATVQQLIVIPSPGAPHLQHCLWRGAHILGARNIGRNLKRRGAREGRVACFS